MQNIPEHNGRIEEWHREVGKQQAGQWEAELSLKASLKPVAVQLLESGYKNQVANCSFTERDRAL